jgi:hypothetical protein
MLPFPVASAVRRVSETGKIRLTRSRKALVMTTVQLSTPVRTVSDSTTRSLLVCGIVSAPLWAAVSLIQAATREGYDLTRHPLSVLSNGPLGWIQTTNFLVCGILTVAGAVGLRRSLASTWAPRLIALEGAGMFAAGVFRMDPADGFPSGTPAGMPTTMTWHSILHMVSGSIAFTALIAACFVLGRHFSRAVARSHATASRLAGTVLLLGDGWAMTGGKAGSLTLAVGVITAMIWVSAVAAEQIRASRLVRA